MAGKDVLRFVGLPLFDSDDIDSLVIGFVREQIASAYVALRKKPERPSKLRLRREVNIVGMPDPVTLGEWSPIAIGPTDREGVLVAETRVAFSGQAVLLSVRPEPPIALRRPIAEIEGDVLVLSIAFAESDRTFVSPMIRSEIALIDDYLSAQRDAFAAWDRKLPKLLKTEVDAAWPGLRSRKRLSDA